MVKYIKIYSKIAMRLCFTKYAAIQEIKKSLLKTSLNYLQITSSKNLLKLTSYTCCKLTVKVKLKN